MLSPEIADIAASFNTLISVVFVLDKIILLLYEREKRKEASRLGKKQDPFNR